MSKETTKNIIFKGRRADNGELVQGGSVVTMIHGANDKRLYIIPSDSEIIAPFWDDSGNCYQVSSDFILIEPNTLEMDLFIDEVETIL